VSSYKHMQEPPQPPRVRALRWVSIAFLFVACGVLGALAIDSIVSKRSPQDLVGTLFVEQPQSHFHKDRIALLLLGIDYNYDSKDQEYSTNARTDTIMALSVNFPTAAQPRGSIGVLSIPRDTDVVYANGHEDKINAAYTYGKNPPEAAHASESTVAKFLGVPGFDRYVTLRINAAKELVDAIGGIDVVPDETMNYDDSWGHLHIHFIGGKPYHMNGEQAVSYSRFRHDACSDPCRIKRQQQVMKIVFNKLSSDKLNDLAHFNALIGVVRRNVITDLSDREALSIAMAMRNVDLKSVKMNQVPFVGDKDLACCGDVLIADDAGKTDLVHKLFLDPLVPVAPPNPQAVAAVPASRIRVEVRNGSGIPGLGHKVAASLQKQGFAIDRVGNADHYDYASTEVHVHSATPLAGDRVRIALAVHGAKLTPEVPVPGAKPTSDVTVIVGRDYAAVPETEASAVK
jgi:polyisoprenyl-teichoic acid--peptidoglycan teichoic acid transferase